MIPKYTIPEIKEFMTGKVVEACYSYNGTMKIFIPALMLDKSVSSAVTNIPVKSTTFVADVSKIVSSYVASMNYIVANISPIIPHLYPDKLYSVGETVRLYIPKLDLEQAMVILM